jgi:hypothetical protein
MQFKIYLFSFLFLYHLQIKAQLDISTLTSDQSTYQVTYNVNGSLAYLGDSETKFSQTNPGYWVWFEYGDGKFTFQPKFKHNYNNVGVNTRALLRLSGVYEGGNKPTRILNSSFISQNNTLTNNADYEANDPLASSYNIKLTPSVPAIRANDIITYAIDYKIPIEQPGWKLVFEYNLDKTHYFHQTTPNDFFTDLENPNEKISFIRTHNGEKPNNITTNKIIFDLPSTLNNRNTVFVSLATFSDLKEEIEGYGSVTAYLISPKNPKGEIDKANKDVSSLRNIGDKPHDPNWIKVDKKCLKPSTVNTVLNYHIHFQNTGTGPANDMVVIAAKLPKNINANALSIAANNFSANYGGLQLTNFVPYVHDPITTYDHNYSTIHNAHTVTTTTTGTSTVSTYKINNLPTVGTCFYDFTSHNDSIFFMVVHPETSGREILHGMKPTNPNFMNDPKTMGDIKFKVTLGTYAAPDSLEMIAQIVFDGEHPVYTEEESIKVKRRCKTRPQAPCNCNSGTKRSFWQWLREKCQ